MKKILFSSALILFVGGAVALGGTGAFFSDSESSSGNTFTAGAIDLKVDNHSYYNGQLNASTTWEVSDLTIQKFFDFPDLKPGDIGEDTISLHVNNNAAYLCANVKLTSNDENGQTEPEALVDATTGPGVGAGLGELASNVNFVWWADDGDNVLETNEAVISQGPIGSLGLNGSTTVALADSQNNIWTNTPGPVDGGKTYYIGKAWCFGTIGTSPLSQDGLGTTSPRTPGNSSGGITCDGHLLNNSTQTDSLTADVKFTAVQARNNSNYLCVPPVVRQTGKLTVVKIVINNNGGNNVAGDFHFFLDDGFVSSEVFSGATSTLPVGAYSVSETGVSGYVGTYGGDCDSEGNVTVTANSEKICYITNDDLPANITLIKVVQGNTTDPSLFKMRIDGTLVPNTTSLAVTSNANHFITEDAKAGYHFVSLTGAGCPASTSTPVVLNEGQAITCTITNAAN
jgi:predicted ribosomally synthesized peptide with SipW-like signal peptide